VTLLGQALIARDLDGSTAERRVRIAVPHRSTALGIPVTQPVGQPETGRADVPPSDVPDNGARR
jgi:hypothetical protein